TVTGYASILANSPGQAPAGLAIFGLRQNGVLVTEASVPASPAIQHGRTFAEVNGTVNTGLAIANPNIQPVTVAFFFTGTGGHSSNGTLTIPGDGQLSAFLNQSPFNGPS